MFTLIMMAATNPQLGVIENSSSMNNQLQHNWVCIGRPGTQNNWFGISNGDVWCSQACEDTPSKVSSIAILTIFHRYVSQRRENLIILGTREANDV